MTGMTCLYVFFEGLFMRKIVVTKLTNVPVEMKVVIHIRSFNIKKALPKNSFLSKC